MRALQRLVRYLRYKKVMNRFATVVLAFSLASLTLFLAGMVYAMAREVGITAGMGVAFGAAFGGILFWLYQQVRQGLRQW
jgi:hypothetical protein